jgi:phosphoglycerate dehydrogenase-like enzyme
MYTTDNLDEALCGADIIALCLPGTDGTRGMFGRKRLESLKRGAYILNVGRGSALDQEALADLLDSGRIGGAGLDVTEPEPLPANSRLWAHPNAIITPHISGGMSLELTLDLIVDKFVRYLGDYIDGNVFEKAVDRQVGY